MGPTDSELLEAWRHGDKAAAGALLDRYYRPLERFFLYKVGDAAEDLIQETFAACVAGKEQVRKIESFRSYLFAIAHNLLRAHLRKHTARKGALDFDEVSVEDLAPGQGTLAERRRERRALLEALRKIPLALQVLLEMHYWEGFTTEEIAAALDVPLGTVRGRLQRARAALEAALAKLEKTALADTLSSLDDWARECKRERDAAGGSPDDA